MTNKHVAMISVHECPLASSEGKERGGINVYVYELSKALSKLGWSIDIYTRVQDDTNPRVVQVSESLRVIHIPCGPHTPLSKKEILRHLDEFSTNVTTFIKTNDLTYHVIHAHYYLSGIVAKTISESHTTKIPWVITFHTLGLMKQLVNHAEAIEDPQSRVPLEKALAQKASAIITTSENDASYVSALYDAPENHVYTIPPGVDIDLFSPQSKSEAKKIIGADPDHHIILAVGRIDPVKGFDVLLYAMKILLTKPETVASRTCLWIVGGDVGENQSKWSTELTKLNHLQKELNLSSTVKFVPAQPQEKLVHFYNAADVVVMPSHYESFGMVALEALACDRPVITTDVMGISPLLKEFPKGHVVSANNPVLLADLLIHVLTQPHGYYKDEKTMQTFSWNSVAKRVSKLYEKIANH